MTSIARTGPARRCLRILRRPTESIRPAMPRPERRDCQGRLVAALLALGGPGCTLVAASLRPWCSATFIGAQHRITLAIAGRGARDRAEALARRIGEVELPISGHIVADVAVDGIRTAEDGTCIRTAEDGTALIELAALTIEDW